MYRAFLRRHWSLLSFFPKSISWKVLLLGHIYSLKLKGLSWFFSFWEESTTFMVMLDYFIVVLLYCSITYDSFGCRKNKSAIPELLFAYFLLYNFSSKWIFQSWLNWFNKRTVYSLNYCLLNLAAQILRWSTRQWQS